MICRFCKVIQAPYNDYFCSIVLASMLHDSSQFVTYEDTDPFAVICGVVNSGVQLVMAYSLTTRTCTHWHQWKSHFHLCMGSH